MCVWVSGFGLSIIRKQASRNFAFTSILSRSSFVLVQTTRMNERMTTTKNERTESTTYVVREWTENRSMICYYGQFPFSISLFLTLTLSLGSCSLPFAKWYSHNSRTKAADVVLCATSTKVIFCDWRESERSDERDPLLMLLIRESLLFILTRCISLAKAPRIKVILYSWRENERTKERPAMCDWLKRETHTHSHTEKKVSFSTKKLCSK